MSASSIDQPPLGHHALILLSGGGTLRLVRPFEQLDKPEYLVMSEIFLDTGLHGLVTRILQWFSKLSGSDPGNADPQTQP